MGICCCGSFDWCLTTKPITTARADVPAFMARYDNRVPDGVVNDRFYQIDLGPLRHLVRLAGVRTLVDGMASKAFRGGVACFQPPLRLHHARVLLARLPQGEEVGDLPPQRCSRWRRRFGCSWTSSARTATCF